MTFRWWWKLGRQATACARTCQKTSLGQLSNAGATRGVPWSSIWSVASWHHKGHPGSAAAPQRGVSDRTSKICTHLSMIRCKECDWEVVHVCSEVDRNISPTLTLSDQFISPIFILVKYGIILGSNWSNSEMVLTIQEDIVRIILAAKPLTPCGLVFKKLEIWLVSCQCIFSLMNFVVNIQEKCETNLCVLFVNTRNKHHLHRSVASVLCFRKVHSVLASNCWTVYDTLSNLRN